MHRFKIMLPIKIIPDKKYKYWQYKLSSKTIHEAGDTIYRKLVKRKFETYRGYGVPSLGGGHPYGAEVYIITADNQKVTFIQSDSEFRKFLGTIDNLEEALLLARTYNCIPNGKHNGNEYRKVEDNFELHLTRFDKIDRLEFVSVKITKDSHIEIESLGFL